MANYDYDANGLLTTTTLSTGQRTVRTNDLAGRVIQYQEWNADGTGRSSSSRTWDKDNKLLDDHNDLKNSGTRYSYLNDGTLSGSVTYSADSSATTITTSYGYLWFDDAKQAGIDVQASNGQVNGPWAPGFTRFGYDVNGNLKTAYDPTGRRSFSYYTDAQGHILQRDELMGGTFDQASRTVIGASKNRTQSYYYFDGRRIGNVGNDGVEREDYAQQLARPLDAPSDPDSKYKNFTPVASADFDQNYQPINATYPSSSASSYTVREGESLQSIARSVWGDASLWYLIADANGLQGTQPGVALTANTVLAIPNKVTNIHNTSQTFRPYDAGKAIGDTSPTIPNPPPAGDDDDCGGLGEIIMIVVAIVVVINGGPDISEYFAEIGAEAAAAEAAASAAAIGGSEAAVATAYGSAYASALAAPGAFVTAAAGAVTGIAASVASQLTGMALGVQKSFDWKGVALGALGGGVAGGLQGAGILANSPALRMAAGSAITQGLAVATGLQQRFDWKGVMASAAQGYMGEYLSKDVMGEQAKRLVGNLGGGLAYAAVHGGSVAQALPGIIANAVGNTVADNLRGQTTQRGVSALEGVFGNGLEGAFVDNAGRLGTKEDRLGDFIAQQQAAQDQRDRSTALYGLNSGGTARLGEPSGSGVAEWWNGVDRAISRSATEQAAIEQRLVELAPKPVSFGPSIMLADAGGGSPFTRGSSGPSFQEINDRKVLAGAYDRINEIGRAWSAGDYGSVWRHVTFESSGEARAALNQRMNPTPTVEQLRFQTDIGLAVGGPLTGWAAGARLLDAPDNIVNGIGVAQSGLIGSFAPAVLGRGSLVARPEWGGPVSYSFVDSPSVGLGKEFTQTQKINIYAENIRVNGGVLRSDLNGEVLVLPVRNQSGVTPPLNAAQIDHVVPRRPADPTVSPGSNSYTNAEVLSRVQNRWKSNR
ncbi:LysM peptidoglycan-binding domain-containing protein [Variovorax terrae]|uniref:LysM peptidoglycan-binding domain-containing protein n=1 Tax=Variovorax terrae TaxID=2923278 RepID=A0A9X2AP57_9BURK|nr:LysM peptidoglycan-binding domain-containing protein [Variovorax terrae]MCJ0764510.1 LysM peptidoglycan-binding domain-containing protein [Variovorax terrae]